MTKSILKSPVNDYIVFITIMLYMSALVFAGLSFTYYNENNITSSSRGTSACVRG